MKKGKQSEQTIAKYVGFLIELKKAVELNPQMTTSTLVKKHQVSYDTVTILKQTGTLVWNKGKGWEWKGSYPNAEMVYKINILRINKKTARNQERSEQLQLNLPTKKRTRASLPKGRINPLEEIKPKPKIEHFETVDQWKARIKEELEHNKPNTTAIPINIKHETRQEYKDLINAKQKPYRVVTLETEPTPTPKPKRSWELKIFGITIIKINR